MNAQTLFFMMECRMDFCASRYHVFSRDLLDVWMFDVCGVDMSFRDAFSSWKRKTSSPSSSFIWLENPPLVKRRMGNEAFNGFLRTVRFSNENRLVDLFRATTANTWVKIE